MSVPVNARKEGKLNVLVLALDLTTYTIMICKNPKVFNPLYNTAITTKEKVYECFNGWKNHAGHGNSTLLIARMDAYLKEMLEVKDVSKAQ